MNGTKLSSTAVRWVLLVGIAVAVPYSAAIRASGQEPPESLPPPIATAEPTDQADDIEVLTRGPLHEAFAEPYRLDATPGQIVPLQPPADIDEVPPEVRPDGENVEWIPGYWAWESVEERFVWVSGIWREVPPGKKWVPGYWAAVEGGYQWVAGFWGDETTEELTYLPPPPMSLDLGPSAPSPGENYFYVPGMWIYELGSYRWRPGYWAPCHERWVWIPAAYVWTPRGCIFRPGYWDWDVIERGWVFAPVYFPSPIYRRPNYCYWPKVVINIDVHWLVHLFVSPDHHHYCFGDYYDHRYRQHGFCAWIDLHSRYHWHDPLYAYYKARPRHSVVDLEWIDRAHRDSETNESLRPGRTFRPTERLAVSVGDEQPRSGRSLGRSIEELKRQPNLSGKARDVVRVSGEELEASQRVQPYRQLADRRRTSELAALAPGSRNEAAPIKPRALDEPLARTSRGSANPQANLSRGARGQPPRPLDQPAVDLRIGDRVNAARQLDSTNRLRSTSGSRDLVDQPNRRFSSLPPTSAARTPAMPDPVRVDPTARERLDAALRARTTNPSGAASRSAWQQRSQSLNQRLNQLPTRSSSLPSATAGRRGWSGNLPSRTTNPSSLAPRGGNNNPPAMRPPSQPREFTRPPSPTGGAQRGQRSRGG